MCSRTTALVALITLAAPVTWAAVPARSPALSEILAASVKSEWRVLDPARTLYLDLPAGRVVIELAPEFTPLHVGNVLTLVREKYFDGLAVIRSQDNFVVQWGDPDDKKSQGGAKTTLPAEFTAPIDQRLFTRLPDRDGFAPQVGFINSMAVARDPAQKQQWLTHCYGAVGVARGNESESGNGASLYVAIGQAPRQLDRNIAVIGHVWQGMEWLATLPRGAGAMGFYEQPEQLVTIKSVRLAADVPVAERTALEVLRSESRSFATMLDARRHRRDDWTRFSAGFLDVCNIPVPVRPVMARDRVS
jgi:peptidylprolyl isomerase